MIHKKRQAGALTLGLLPLWLLKIPMLALAVPDNAPVSYSATRLFLTFLKIGAVLYGSGYVLLAFLESDFVNNYGWLTQEQLIDGVAIGQFTPGPVFTTATFVGYVTGGFTGAILATLGIFIPSFIFVALMRPALSRARGRDWTAALLDGVNAAALGLMAAVTRRLGEAAIIDVVTALLAIGALLVLLRFKPNSAWLIIAGAAVGLTYQGLF
ncbi:MAG: chromate transporter [Thermomicrobiales bacterium]